MDDRFRVKYNYEYFIVDLGMMKAYRDEMAGPQWDIKIVDDKLHYYRANDKQWYALDNVFNEAYHKFVMDMAVEYELLGGENDE